MSRLKKGSRKKLTPLFSNRGVTFWKKWILEPPKALWGLGLQDSERGHKVLIFRSQSAYISVTKCLYFGHKVLIFWRFFEGEFFLKGKRGLKALESRQKPAFFLS